MAIFLFNACNELTTDQQQFDQNYDNGGCSAYLLVHTEEYLVPGHHNPIPNANVTIYYPNGTLLYESYVTDINGNLNVNLNCNLPVGYYRVVAKTYNGIYIWQYGWNNFLFNGVPENIFVNVILEHVLIDQ